MPINRREFLTRSIGGSALIASGLSVPDFLLRSAVAAGDFAPGRERILVVLELTGGNDGLNTVVPYRDAIYYRQRPTIAVPRGQVLPIGDDLGFHPALRRLTPMFEEGAVAVVENVGYPNPDRSHFRSMDIWQTASVCPEQCRTGWLGRVADRHGARRDTPPVLHLDQRALPRALRTEGRPVPSIAGLDAFRLVDGARDIEEALTAGCDKPAGSDLDFVRRTALTSCAHARRLEGVKDGRGGEAAYPAHGLARRLEQIARLIGAEFGPRVYYTSLGGFDTHARQAATHRALLRELAESVGAFFEDLRARRLRDRVALMTFSEFGRRVAENGSQGTDHGAAAPLLVVGPGVRGGILGGRPDLENLGRGDVEHRVDFRQVYASVLAHWLGVDPKPILSGSHPPLKLFKAARRV